MLYTLPPFSAPEPNSLWYSELVAPTHTAASSSSHDGSGSSTSRQNQQSRRRQSVGSGGARTQLTELRADEAAISGRKGNIRRFGAGWLRPPGVGKTLQGLWDEKLEREEAEQAAMREAALAEAQAAQEEAEREENLRRGADGEGDAAAGERDLDDDIPEARDQGSWESDEEEEDGEEGFGGGDEGEGDYAEVVQVGVDGDALAMDAGDRDLDDDVPEAGSYEHTDTEDEEDEEGSDVEVDDETRVSMAVPGAAQQGASAILAGSFGSSPAGGRQYSRRSTGHPGRQ